MDTISTAAPCWQHLDTGAVHAGVRQRPYSDWLSVTRRALERRPVHQCQPEFGSMRRWHFVAWPVRFAEGASRVPPLFPVEPKSKRDTALPRVRVSSALQQHWPARQAHPCLVPLLELKLAKPSRLPLSESKMFAPRSSDYSWCNRRSPKHRDRPHIRTHRDTEGQQPVRPIHPPSRLQVFHANPGEAQTVFVI